MVAACPPPRNRLPANHPSARTAVVAALGTRLTRSFLLASRRLAVVSALSAAALSVLLALLAVAWLGAMVGR